MWVREQTKKQVGETPTCKVHKSLPHALFQVLGDELSHLKHGDL